MKISLGTMKEKGKDLADFLEPRVGTKPELSGDSIEIGDEGLRQGVRPRHVKTYIKRFMYMNGLRKNYRVFVAGKELTIQELELGEEEEKKEKKEKAEAPVLEEAKEEPSEPDNEEEAKQAKAEKPKKSAKKPRAKKKKEPAEG